MSEVAVSARGGRAMKAPALHQYDSAECYSILQLAYLDCDVFNIRHEQNILSYRQGRRLKKQASRKNSRKQRRCAAQVCTRCSLRAEDDKPEPTITAVQFLLQGAIASPFFVFLHMQILHQAVKVICPSMRLIAVNLRIFRWTSGFWFPRTSCYSVNREGRKSPCLSTALGKSIDRTPERRAHSPFAACETTLPVLTEVQIAISPIDGTDERTTRQEDNS